MLRVRTSELPSDRAVKMHCKPHTGTHPASTRTSRCPHLAARQTRRRLVGLMFALMLTSSVSVDLVIVWHTAAAGTGSLVPKRVSAETEKRSVHQQTVALRTKAGSWGHQDDTPKTRAPASVTAIKYQQMALCHDPNFGSSHATHKWASSNCFNAGPRVRLSHKGTQCPQAQLRSQSRSQRHAFPAVSTKDASPRRWLRFGQMLRSGTGQTNNRPLVFTLVESCAQEMGVAVRGGVKA